MAQTDDLGPVSRSFISQRLRLNYVDWGNASAPTLVLVHGGRDHARSWDWVARSLRHDWHVIAPDLRGHGDSNWSPDGAYDMGYYVYDLAQLIHQQGDANVTIVGHSLGGAISLRYASLYPDTVRKLVAIEGLGLSPESRAKYEARSPIDKWVDWIEERRGLAMREPRRYPTVDAALQRMKVENAYLTDEQARHLTMHGVSRNEDGTYSWKFDNYVRSHTPADLTTADQQVLWGNISCPTLLAYGRNSWASNPETDGRAAHFKHATVKLFDDAGHWLHHDQFDAFMAELKGFI